MHSWDAWGRGGDLGWPDIALRAHHKGSRDGNREKTPSGELGCWGEGRGHAVTRKRAGMVGWVGGIDARAWGGVGTAIWWHITSLS